MYNEVQKRIASLRPELCRYGCDVELISVADGVVGIRMVAGPNI